MFCFGVAFRKRNLVLRAAFRFLKKKIGYCVFKSDRSDVAFSESGSVTSDQTVTRFISS